MRSLPSLRAWARTAGALAALAFAAGCAAAPACAADAKHPTVIELFQSQGCSSCPPANANLIQFAARDDVLALNFAVDYWDRLGWKDTFAKPEFTARQWAYARRHGARGRLYAADRRQWARRAASARTIGEMRELALRDDRGDSGPELTIGAGRSDDRRGACAAARRRRLARALRSWRRSRSRCSAAKTPAARCRTRTWCAKWFSSAIGAARPSASRCRRRADRGSSTRFWCRRPAPARSSPRPRTDRDGHVG